MEASFQATSTMVEMQMEGVELAHTLGHKTPPKVLPKPSSKSPTQPSLVAKVTGGRQQSPSPVRHVKAPTPTTVRWVEPPVYMVWNWAVEWQVAIITRTKRLKSTLSISPIRPVKSPVTTRKQPAPATEVPPPWKQGGDPTKRGDQPIKGVREVRARPPSPCVRVIFIVWTEVTRIVGVRSANSFL